MIAISDKMQRFKECAVQKNFLKKKDNEMLKSPSHQGQEVNRRFVI